MCFPLYYSKCIIPVHYILVINNNNCADSNGSSRELVVNTYFVPST